MKISLIFFLLLTITLSTNSQQREWLVYSTPSLLYKYLPADYPRSIAIAGNADKPVGNFVASVKKDETDWGLPAIPNTGILPDNYILCMSQDGDGNIWVGTYYGGVAKFDGTNWTVYNTLNSKLPNNTIYSLAIDGKGNKWFGTTEGLVKFDGRNWTVFNTANSGLPNNIIYSIAVDGKGNKWVGTLAGLVKYDGKKWIVYKRSNSKLPDNSVTSVTIDKNGDKWIGTFAGLAKFDDTKWKVYNTSNSRLPFNDIYSTTIDKNGGIIIETWGGGLAKLNGKRWTVYKKSNSGLPDNNISSFVADEKGNFWIGTLAGLVKLNGGKFTIYNTSNSSLPDNRVYTLLYDKSGNLWIGTEAGLAIFKEGGIVHSQAGLTKFYSVVRNGGIALLWQTSTEKNNSGFEIERKIGNSGWGKIGYTAAHRNSNSAETYSYIDGNPVSGKVYYRLKQIDLALKYRYSRIIETLIEAPATNRFGDNFPNPFSLKTKINFSLQKKSFTKIEVFNSLGVILSSLNKEFGAGFHEFEFDGKNFNPGFYFYRITTENLSTFKTMLLLR